MKTETLYWPRNPQYPFVDLLWKEDDDTVHMLQVTVSDSHAKPLPAFQLLKNKLGLEPESQLTIHYVVLPKHAEKFAGADTDAFFFSTLDATGAEAFVTVKSSPCVLIRWTDG